MWVGVRGSQKTTFLKTDYASFSLVLVVSSMILSNIIGMRNQFPVCVMASIQSWHVK